jgi:DNA-binding NarL/FixJ family response regulator
LPPGLGGLEATPEILRSNRGRKSWCSPNTTTASIHRGGLVLDPSLAREALLPAAAGVGEERYQSLTEREKQVLKLVAEGNSNKEMAQLLGISVKTAMSHRERMMQKLDIHNRTELVKFALKLGVIKL